MKKLIIIMLSLVVLSINSIAQEKTRTEVCHEIEASLAVNYPDVQVVYRARTVVFQVPMDEFSTDVNKFREIIKNKEALNHLARTFANGLNKEVFNSYRFYYINFIFKDNAVHGYEIYVSDDIYIQKYKL